MPRPSPKILIIRRDNIGDLVCTTPLIRALRGQLPDAHIAVLANTYNAAVLDRNPDVDAVHAYTKGKHRGERSHLAVLAERIALILALRGKRFDWILLPAGPQSSALRFARMIGGGRILVRDHGDAAGGLHHAQQCCHLLTRMGLNFETPPPRLVPDAARVRQIMEGLPQAWERKQAPLVALHLSSRKPSQQWPAERFAGLARCLHDQSGARFLLFWSPGPKDDPRHPGDDDAMRDFLNRAEGLPVHPVPTASLPDLIAAITLCDAMVCSDGGAMHLAAALGKPLLAMFGDSDPEHWGPLGTDHVVLHPAGRDVAALGVEEVTAELFRLLQRKGFVDSGRRVE